MTLYRIKPLEWKREKRASWSALAPGDEFPYRVIREDGKFQWRSQVSCDWHPCDSLAHGKQLAEAHYVSRLLPALVEVEG